MKIIGNPCAACAGRSSWARSILPPLSLFFTPCGRFPWLGLFGECWSAWAEGGLLREIRQRGRPCWPCLQTHWVGWSRIFWEACWWCAGNHRWISSLWRCGFRMAIPPTATRPTPTRRSSTKLESFLSPLSTFLVSTRIFLFWQGLPPLSAGASTHRALSFQPNSIFSSSTCAPSSHHFTALMALLFWALPNVRWFLLVATASWSALISSLSAEGTLSRGRPLWIFVTFSPSSQQEHSSPLFLPFSHSERECSGVFV